MSVISGYHVDEYCVQAFREAVRVLQERFAAEKVTDFADIAPGDLIARVPPKIIGDQHASGPRPVPIYRILAAGDDFDENGQLISTGQSDYLYFQADSCYLLDVSAGEPRLEQSGEHDPGLMDCFDARDVGRVKDQHAHLEDDLKGILYKLPRSVAEDVERQRPESAEGIAGEA